MAVLESILKQDELTKQLPVRTKLIKVAMEQIGDETSTAPELVTHFRPKATLIDKKKDKAKEPEVKVSWAVNGYGNLFRKDFYPAELHGAIREILMKLDGYIKPGPPPKLEVERATERLLERLEKK